MAIQVDCYAGYRGDETPRRFRLDEKRIEIVEVRARWTTPEHRCFKVLGDDGAVYLLRHDGAAWDCVT